MKRISGTLERDADGYSVPFPDAIVEASGLKPGDPVIIEAECGRISILKLDPNKASSICGVM